MPMGLCRTSPSHGLLREAFFFCLLGVVEPFAVGLNWNSGVCGSMGDTNVQSEGWDEGTPPAADVSVDTERITGLK